MTAHTEAPSELRYSITERYFAGEDGPMRYWESQPPSGVPLLLIHGYGALIEHWRPVMRPIARQHALYALDLYGFGYSARPALRPSKERWAAQVASFINGVIGQPTVVVGHSMGGVVAAELARSKPDLVRALVLVNSSGAQRLARPLSSTDRLLLDLIGAPLLGETLAGFFANAWSVRQGLLSSYHRKERVTPELVETFYGPIRAHGISSYLETTRAVMNLVLSLRPGDVTVPTLLIWGAEDRSIPPQHAQLIKEHMLPQAEIRILAESGHCPFDETPDEFCATLLPWLRQL